jgi:hypothetical protein
MPTSALYLPSASDIGAAWLDNFEPHHQATARILIDSLRIASEGELRSGLLSKLEETVASIQRPILILPIRDLVDFGFRKSPKMLAVFRDFQPSARFRAAPGSEVIAANVIRDVVGLGRQRNTGFLNPNGISLEDLRTNRCRSLVLVDDYSGSGSQGLSYVRAWLRNPTIRSWRSFGWFKIYLVYFAVSKLAVRRFRMSESVDGVHFVETAADFSSADWSKSERSAVIEICTAYAEARHVRSGQHLGFASSKGLFVMQRTVPNNLPSIFTQKRGRKARPWAPLFPGRIFPPELQEQLAGYRPREEFEPAASELADSDRKDVLPHINRASQRQYMLILAALAGRSTDFESIAEAYATTTLRVSIICSTLKYWGLIDKNRHLTDRGWLALRRARMRPRRITFRLQETAEPYYPQQLRGVDVV